jgi:hypothetical protein
MAIKLRSIFGRVIKMFRTRPGSAKSAAYVSALRTYAKTEYGSDWVFALNYMLENDGQGPRYTGRVHYDL